MGGTSSVESGVVRKVSQIWLGVRCSYDIPWGTVRTRGTGNCVQYHNPEAAIVNAFVYRTQVNVMAHGRLCHDFPSPWRLLVIWVEFSIAGEFLCSCSLCIVLSATVLVQNYVRGYSLIEKGTVPVNIGFSCRTLSLFLRVDSYYNYTSAVFGCRGCGPMYPVESSGTVTVDLVRLESPYPLRGNRLGD